MPRFTQLRPVLDDWLREVRLQLLPDPATATADHLYLLELHCTAMTLFARVVDTEKHYKNLRQAIYRTYNQRSDLVRDEESFRAFWREQWPLWPANDPSTRVEIASDDSDYEDDQGGYQGEEGERNWWNNASVWRLFPDWFMSLPENMSSSEDWIALLRANYTPYHLARDWTTILHTSDLLEVTPANALTAEAVEQWHESALDAILANLETAGVSSCARSVASHLDMVKAYAIDGLRDNTTHACCRFTELIEEVHYNPHCEEPSDVDDD